MQRAQEVCITSKDGRKLCLSFDLFMAYKEALPIIPKLSGIAYPSNESMVPMDLTHKKWREELESTCSLVIISFMRSCCIAKVARVS